MITNVQIRDDLGEILGSLPLYSADLSSRYVIKKIDGIGPPSAELALSTYAGYDGGLLIGNRTSVRSIVLTIGYRPDWRANQTVESLRGELYRYFPPKETLNLRFNNDNALNVRWIEGVVESHEPNIFTKDPEVVVSITCPDPDFKPLRTQTLSGFINTTVDVSYFGTADTGFLLNFFSNRNFGELFINNFQDPEIVIRGALAAGETLQISTVRGNKFVRVVRGGVPTNSLDYLESGLLSMVLSRKTKKFEIRGSGSPDAPYSIKFTPRYIGV